MRRLPLAEPRDPRADAYPMPRVPRGWYAVARSSEITGDAPTSLHYFGRALVGFRDEKGKAHVLDAHCPHYGAHLGEGGRIVDGKLECPFHGWQFDGEGQCVHAPFVSKPPRAETGKHPVVERSGLVYVHASDAEPQFAPPRVHEAEDERFASPIVERHRMRTHIQEIRENIVDESHFHYIHGQDRPSDLVFEEDGPRAYAHGALQKRVFGVSFDQSFDVEMHGPGIMVVRTVGRYITTTTIALTTPVDDSVSELRLLHYVKRKPNAPWLTPLQKAFFSYIARPEVLEEKRIWDHKVWRERPILLPHETGIRALRRWYAQFYADEQQDGRVTPRCATG